MLEICDDADKISHAAPLASFSDMLAEKYLWPQSDENDEERWEEYFYDDELFYSLYFYSRAVLDATGVETLRSLSLSRVAFKAALSRLLILNLAQRDAL